MWIYAGIDEAGYGPIFGPLVVARAVFALEGEAPQSPLPSLWTVMNSGVCRSGRDSRDRIAVADSKLLYTPALGLKHLERTVLGFLRTLGGRPAALQELLDLLALDELSSGLNHPCYLREDGGPSLPSCLEEKRVERAGNRLERLTERTGARLVDLGAGMALEDRFNRMLEETGNKSLCAWTFVSAHLRFIWERYGTDAPQVVIDRQGGRIYYLQLLSELFPEARLCILEEAPASSRYQIHQGERSMVMTVQVAAEKSHLPVALASMCAKYLRELTMGRFHDFWRHHAPDVRPTFGYYGDGRRFLREIEPLLHILRLEREILVRRL